MKLKRLTAAFVTAAMILSSAGAVSADPALVTEETAFAAAWDEISDAVRGAYTAFYGILGSKAVDADLPAYRLSLEPDALKLLGFASESLLKTDLSWVDEIGIDLIPSFQKFDTTYYMYNGPVTQEMYLPGMCAVLHVNDKEILTADIVNEIRSGYAYVKIPELVSGSSYVDMTDQYSGLEELFSFMGGSFDRYSFVRTLIEADRLLPDPELFGMILETAGGLEEAYVPETSGESALTAGDISENTTAYTGQMSARDMVSLLPAYLDRLEKDEKFRNAVISYIDGFYELLNNNYFLKSLIYLAARSGPQFLYTVSGGDNYAAVYAAMLTGNWKFAEESLNQRYENTGTDSAEEIASAAADSAEDTVFSEAAAEAADYGEETAAADAADYGEEAAAADTADSEEEAAPPEEDTGRSLEDITLVPGREYSWEEVNESPKDFSLMLQGYLEGGIILTDEQSAGNNVYTLYQSASSQVREALSALAEETDENAALRITTAFDGDQKLKGLTVDPVIGEEAFGELSLAWPENGEGRAVQLNVEAPSEETASVLVQILADSFKAEAAASGIGHYHLSGEKTTDENGDVYSARVRGNDVEVAWLEGTVTSNGRGIDLSLHIPEYEDREMKARFFGTYDAESGKGSFKTVFTEGSAEYPNSMYQAERGAISIETDRLKIKKDGTLSGRASVSLNGRSIQQSPIPQGMKLVFDFGKGQVSVADASSTYLTFSMTEKPVISRKKAASRIKTAWEGGMEGRFGSNWNFACPISRLLKAGMPEDLLKGLPLTMEDISDLIDDLTYELNYMGW